MMMVIVFVEKLNEERCFFLFSDRTIIRDSHRHKSLTHRKQDLNLCRTLSQALLNEVV